MFVFDDVRTNLFTFQWSKSPHSLTHSITQLIWRCVCACLKCICSRVWRAVCECVRLCACVCVRYYKGMSGAVLPACCRMVWNNFTFTMDLYYERVAYVCCVLTVFECVCMHAVAIKSIISTFQCDATCLTCWKAVAVAAAAAAAVVTAVTIHRIC